MRPALVLVAAGLVVAYLQHALQHGTWQVDDAGITFAYARNIAAGHGPVTNPGDLMVNEGYSNPAWTALLASFMFVGAFDMVWTPKVLSVLFALAGFAVCAWLVRRFDDGEVQLSALAPAALLVANGSWVAWSIGGLENPQYVTTILFAMAMYLRDVSRIGQGPPVSGPFFFLAAVSRPEGLLYTFAAGGDAVLRTLRNGNWRWLVQLVAGLAVPLGLYLTWHVWMFDDVLPNTYYAKSREASLTSRLFNPRSNGWQYVLDGFTRWGQGPVFLLALVGLTDRDAWAKGLGALVLAFVGSVVFALHANGDWMMQFRFLSPTFALAAVLAGVGLATLRRVVLPGPQGAMAEPVLLLLTAGFVGWNLESELAGMRAKPTVPLASRLERLPKLLAVGDDLRLDEPVVLMSDMGGPMWVNGERDANLVDMFGLCTRPVAMALHHRDVDALWQRGFVEPNPDFLQFPPTLYKTWRLDVALVYQGRYTRLDDWRRSDEQTGFFVRRDLIEAPWRPEFATGQVVVQRPISVHEVSLVAPASGEVDVDILFSMNTGAQVTPKARILLRGDVEHDALVPLLPSLKATALRPGVVHRYRARVSVPPRVGTVREARALGTPEPSPLSPPEGWTEVPLVAGGEVAPDFTVSDAAALTVTDGLRYAGNEGDRVCVPPILWSDALRLRGEIGLQHEGRVDLDTRWFDAEGAFLGRERAWSWTQSFDTRELGLAVTAPRQAHTVRMCWVFADGAGVLDVRKLRWERR
jgi:hypothetical protein